MMMVLAQLFITTKKRRMRGNNRNKGSQSRFDSSNKCYRRSAAATSNKSYQYQKAVENLSKYET